ncbi:hypothetical protein TRAPUB_7214 [Trametes pubescens]|uniref:Uncharacterized protein n=1 Tax=Trametes pubescens TaxID=154538 RepID=A0A1M2W6N5_TRAPU|nr:hypothetical protein TRAPUB_7214 [Trametes pubescens]
MTPVSSSPSLSELYDMGEVDSTLLLPDPLMGGYTIEHDHVHDDVPLDDDDPAGDFDPSGSLVDVESSFSPPADVTLSDAELHSDIVAQGFDAEYEPLVSNPSGSTTLSFNNWEGSTLYSVALRELDVLHPSSVALLDSVTKLGRQEGPPLRTKTMDNRVLQGIAEVESYLRATRAALLRADGTDACEADGGVSAAARMSTRARDASPAVRSSTPIGGAAAAARPSAYSCDASPAARSSTYARDASATVRSSTQIGGACTPARPSAYNRDPSLTSRPPTYAGGASTAARPPTHVGAVSVGARPITYAEDASAGARPPSRVGGAPVAVRLSAYVQPETAIPSAAVKPVGKTVEGPCAIPGPPEDQVEPLEPREDVGAQSATAGRRLPSPKAIPDSKSRVMQLCKCSKCIQKQYIDDYNVTHQGVPLDAKRIKQHALDDKFREAAEKARQKAQADVANDIVLATLGAPSRPDQQSLPVRPKSRRPPVKDEVDEGQSEDDEVGTSSGGGSGSLQNPDTREDPGKAGKSTSMSNEERAIAVKERFSRISLLQSQLALRSRYVTRYTRLVFKHTASYSETPGELDGSDGDNTAFTAHRDWVHSTLVENTGLPLVGDRDADSRYIAILQGLEKEKDRLRDLERDAWEKWIWTRFLPKDTGASEPCIAMVPASTMHAQRASMPPFLLAALLMVSILHTLAGVSFPVAQFVLASMKVLLFGAFSLNTVAGTTRTSRPELTAAHKAIVDAIPYDLRTVLKNLQVEPDIVSYACCSKCFAIYHPDSTNSKHPFPRRCTRGGGETGVPSCNRRLIKSRPVKASKDANPSDTADRPIRTYVYRKFKSWLADFLGRPGIETAILESWLRDVDPAKCTDIMDSPTIRQFIGPDGRTLFSVQQNGAVHLVFSLFVDWFNPFGNKKAGKSHSIGAIYLACLNLPPHLRYRPENIYLAGIIPGPKEPQLDQLNELLHPLVNELLELWNPGIYIEKTALRSGGRQVRAAMIPLVCDLPALRKTAGFASHSAKHFCSFCPLTLDDINNIDRSSWPKSRTWEKHLEFAGKWKAASTEATRSSIFAEHGLRWSELLRLPYWDPTRYAVLDVMHNLFLGEVLHHCRQVWGVDVAQDKSPSGQKVGVIHTPAEQQQYLDSVLAATCAGSNKKLANMRRDYLSAVARFNNIVGETKSPPTRQILASALLAWAKTSDPRTLRLPPVLNEPVSRFRLPSDDPPPEVSRYDVFTSEVLEKVRDNIASTVLPSWMEKAPSNFGSAAHGKLKADQWRTVSMVNLVIALVKLWGSASASEEERSVLTNFVHLVAAVDLATRRSMSPERSASYDYHMEEYLRGLRSLFDRKLVPNHHLSLHLRRFLEDFGPVNGWWSFPFERYNGILQRMNTNYKAEDMPGTFIRSWYIGAGLRWLMRTTEWPLGKEYEAMISTFDAAFRDRVRGTRTTDILSAFADSDSDSSFEYIGKNATNLSKDVYEGLLQSINDRGHALFRSIYDSGSMASAQARLPPTGQRVNAVDHAGIRFAAYLPQSRDAYIMFRSLSGAVLAGQISEIFYHQRAEEGRLIVEPFLVVKEYKALSKEHAAHDPYLQFPVLNTRLVYNAFEARPHVVALRDIVCHFAFHTYTPDDVGKEVSLELYFVL